MKKPILEQIHKGLIVSCQALNDEPLHGAAVMAKLAKAAEMGGAVGIRANGKADINEIRKVTELPIIGIIKKDYSDSEVYITPTKKEISELLDSGADMIALDATRRSRPNGEKLEDLVGFLHHQSIPIMADISTLEEAEYAASLGVTCISTTLSGYTPYTVNQPAPDFDLVKQAVESLKSTPVIAEGHIHKPEQAAEMLKLGAFAVVVGSAITRPQLITQRFVQSVRSCITGQTL